MQTARVPHFRPGVSDFLFDNNFDRGIPDAVITIPIINVNLPIGDASQGVCGGMVYAVADFFQASPRQHVPTDTMPPGAGNPLTNYILRRFMDSLVQGNPPNAARYVGLMSIIDHDTDISHGVPWIIVNQEWPKIKADLDAGRPSPIGLVAGVWVWPTNVAAIVEMLGNCHQVLAYGYDLDDSQNLTILIYDPNQHGNTQATIQMNIGNPTHTTPIVSTAGQFRAFFRHEGYTPVLPDAGLSPGPFSLVSSIVPGGPVHVDRPVTLTIDTRDFTTGAAVNGASVLSNGQLVGRTGDPFTTTFHASWVRQPTVDPVTHERSWHWVGPRYPRLQVASQDYDTIDVPATFTGAVPPPAPPDPDL